MTARRGEHLAAVHLRCRGYEVLARNVRTPAGEIDLIARAGGTIVFVEVKTARMRRADGCSEVLEPNPLESLRHRQRLRIRRAAAAWLRGEARHEPLGQRPASVRIDAIGVVLDSRWELVRLYHVEASS